MAFWHLETSLYRLHQSRFLRRPEGRLWLLRAIRLLKTSLKRHRKNSFFRCPGCRNDFAWPFYTFKHRFIDITKFVFLDVQKADYVFSGPFAYLEHDLSDFVKAAFFDAHDAEWFRMVFWYLETSLHRLQQCRFLRRREGSLWVLRAIRLFKTSLKRLRPSRIFRLPECKALRHLETLLHRLQQSCF
jgi:hypothetical protein